MSSIVVPKITIPCQYVRKADIEKGQSVNRKIAVINGFLFYNSSGVSSGLSDTWFPFLGLNPGPIWRGWFIKPMLRDQNLLPYFTRLNQYPFKQLPDRFGSLPAMLISAHLDGGFWKCATGKHLKAKLIRNFPDFFSNIKFELTSFQTQRANTQLGTQEFTSDAIEEFNEWAVQRTRAPSFTDFKLPENIEDIWLNATPSLSEDELSQQLDTIIAREQPPSPTKTARFISNFGYTASLKLGLGLVFAGIFLAFLPAFIANFIFLKSAFLYFSLQGILATCSIGAGAFVLSNAFAEFFSQLPIIQIINSNPIAAASSMDIPLQPTRPLKLSEITSTSQEHAHTAPQPQPRATRLRP